MGSWPRYGGDLPKLAEGAVGNLVLPSTALTDPDAKSYFESECSVMLLPEGSRLYVMVSPPESPALPSNVLRLLIPGTYISSTSGLFGKTEFPFVEIVVRAADGLWIRLRGTKNGTLQPASIFIPALDLEADSVNHAYTLVSQKFEPQRIGHTGNVFDKVFVIHGPGRDGRPPIMRPLRYLRENAPQPV